MRRAIQIDLLILAILFLLPLACFWQVTLGERTLLPADNLYQYQPYAAYRERLGVPDVPHNMLLSDLVLENLQWKRFMRESLAGGEIPLWNPHLFAGVPFLAAGQHSALYPFSLIYYLLPLEKAFGWFTVSQLWLAGAFMFALMRGLGAGRFGALVAGISFQLSGFFLASVVFQMIIAAAAWLPFLLLMVEFTIRRRPLFGHPTLIPWMALGALGLGMTILAGHVEFVYYALLVMGFWAACRLAHLWLTRAQPLRHLAQTSAALIALVVLGMGIGAVQFIPLVELANASSREGRSTFDQVRGYALPSRHALAFLMPNLFGSPARHTYFDVFTGEIAPIDWVIDGARVTDSMMPGGKNYVEGACYVGILTLGLAALALVNMRDRRARLALAGPYRSILVALAVIAASFAFGSLTYAILYYGLPGFSQLHSPFRWVFPLTLCLAALAGFGADAIRVSRGVPGSLTHRAAGWIGAALVGIGVLALIGLLLSRLFYDQAAALIGVVYQGLAGATLVYPDAATFYSIKFMDVLIFGCVALASGLALRGMRRRAGWQVAALLIIALDLILASAGFNPAADPRWLDFEPPALAWLREQSPAEWRLTAIQGQTATLNANIPWLFDLQDIRGYDSIIPRQYVAYMTQIQPQTQLLYNRIAPIFPDTLEALDSPWLDRLAVRYVVAEAPLDLSRFPTYREAYRDEAVIIYENLSAMPRAAVLDVPRCADAESAPMPYQPATLTQTGNIQVMIDAIIPADGPRCLLLADSNAPGWRAYLRPQGTPEEAEQEIAIVPTFGNFRGVELPPGTWTVRFRYSPPSFQVGAFGTFLSLVVLLFAAMIWLWRTLPALGRGTDQSDPTASGVRRFAKNSLAPILLNLFNRGIDLAFAFIMLRLLGPANAGTYYYAIVIFGWFDILTNFGLNTLLTREVARDPASAGRYLLNSSILRLGLAGAGVPVLIGFLLVRGALDPPLEAAAIPAIVLLYIGLIPNSISTGLTALFYAFEKAEVPAAISTVTAILKATLGLGALLAGFGVIGLAAVSILLNLITLAILAWSARGLAAKRPAAGATGRAEGQRPALDRAMMRGMLAAGWPLMLNHLLATIFFKIDVVILEPLQGTAVVGQYSTAYKWLDALGVVPALFTMALLPIMARLAVEDRAGLKRNYHFAVKLMFGLALPIAIATTFMAYFLITLLGGPRFLPDGAIALQLMVWFIPVGWINSLTNYVLIALDQQKPMRWAFLAGVSFNTIANLVFIPVYGYRAAAIVTILSEVVLLIAFYRLLRRALAPVPWIGLLWRFGAAGLTMAAVLAVLWPVAPVLALIAGAVVYPAVLVRLRPFTPWERSRIAALLPGRVRRLLAAEPAS